MSEHSAGRLYMTCKRLAVTHDYEVPAGYRLRWYQPGDEAAWLRIHGFADPLTKLTPGFFRNRFGEDDAFLSRRQAYVLDREASVVGTVTAWEGCFRGEKMGRVHWLAVVPEHQGKGLGGALLSVACKRLIELGYDKAYLVTSPVRTAAIQLYKRFGFKEAPPET